MARRSDHSREELHELVLATATEIAEKDGLRGLTARGIAREIGYTIGTIYNHFDDLDDVIVQLNGRTLDTLHEAMAAIPLDGEPEERANALAGGYMAFVRSHPNLWSVIFEHHLPEERTLPDWHAEKVLGLLGLIEAALAPLFPPGEEAERLHTARVLWSSVHGICSLAVADKLAESETVAIMVRSLIENYLAGLRGHGPSAGVG